MSKEGIAVSNAVARGGLCRCLPWCIDRFVLIGCLCCIASASLAADVVEFYNSTLDNYFITADPTEAAAVDAGAAGPGWSRTGFNFSSGGPTAVCRFYGSVTPGPNSH